MSDEQHEYTGEERPISPMMQQTNLAAIASDGSPKEQSSAEVTHNHPLPVLPDFQTLLLEWMDIPSWKASRK